MRVTRLPLILGGMLLWAGAGYSALSLTNGLLFYLPFEGGTVPGFCGGLIDVKSGAGFLGHGRVGQGFCIAGNASVSVPEPGNFNRSCGTMAFWVQPQWRPAAKDERNLFLVRGSNFQLIWNENRKTMFFMTGSSKAGEGFHWDYSVHTKVPLTWTQSAWHHVAITWDAANGRKQLYLDGWLEANGTTQWIRNNQPRLDDRIHLGSPIAPGLYDEWTIWNRVLAAAEIAKLTQQPQAAAAQLATLKLPETEMKSPVRFDLVRLDPVKTIVDPGEMFHLPTIATNCTSEPLDLILNLSLVDVFGNEIRHWRQELRLKQGEDRPLRFDLRAHRNGVFKLRSELAWNGRTFRSDLGAFAVWPEEKLVPSPDSYFGYHVNSWFGGAFIRQAARLGLSWQRDHDMMQATWWTHVQPKPGQPQWKMDFQLDYCKASGINVLGCLSTVPYWAADPPRPKPAKPADHSIWAKPQLDLFAKYVRRTVARHHNYIHVWEVWNEPATAVFWRGTPEEWARLSRTACRAAKAADPGCRVIVGAFTGVVSREWLERAGKAGAFTNANAISFHGGLGGPEQLQALVKTIRDAASRYALKGKATELWNSEWGVRDSTFLVDADFPDLPPRRLLPPPTFLEGAARVVQLDCFGLALGIKRSFYFLNNDVHGPAAYDNRSMLEFTRTPRPKFLARVALESLVRDARAETTVTRNADAGLTAVVFAGSNETSLAVIWLKTKASAAMSAKWPAGTECYDLFANPVPMRETEPMRLSETPTYVRVKTTWRKLAGLLREAIVTRNSPPK